MLGRIAPEVINEIVAEVEKMPFAKNGVIDNFDADDILKITRLHDIAKMPAATRIAAMHLGAEPKIIDVSLWQTNKGDGGDDAAQRWHRDVDDWRACKMFVYLSDVGPDQGPHHFIPGSHRFKYFQARQLAPETYFQNAGRGRDEVVDMLPRIQITGPAGTMWMANTYCFHKGTPVVSGERIVFQVCYGLMDQERYFAGSKIPRIRAAWG